MLRFSFSSDSVAFIAPFGILQWSTLTLTLFVVFFFARRGKTSFFPEAIVLREEERTEQAKSKPNLTQKKSGMDSMYDDEKQPDFKALNTSDVDTLQQHVRYVFEKILYCTDTCPQDGFQAMTTISAVRTKCTTKGENRYAGSLVRTLKK